MESEPESTVAAAAAETVPDAAIDLVVRSGPNSLSPNSSETNLNDGSTTPKSRKRHNRKDDQQAQYGKRANNAASPNETKRISPRRIHQNVNDTGAGGTAQSTLQSNTTKSSQESPPSVVNHLFNGSWGGFKVGIRSDYFENLKNGFGKLHSDLMKELSDGLKDCMKDFPIPVDGNDNFPVFPKAETICFDSHAGPNCTVTETTDSGKTLSCSIRVQLWGDQITSGEFNVRLGMYDRINPEMMKMLKLEQVGLSAKELQNAYQTFSELEASKSKLISDNVRDRIKTLSQLIKFIEKSQDFFRAPYAKQLEAENLANALIPDNPARKVLFRNQPSNVDVNFYIDDFILVFRWYIRGQCLRTGLTGRSRAISDIRLAGLLSEFDQFRVYAYVEWLNNLCVAYENVLCKAKKLRHMLEFADEIYQHRKEVSNQQNSSS